MKIPANQVTRALRRVRLAMLAVAAVLGFSVNVGANVEKPAERQILEARVLEIRKQLHDAASSNPQGKPSCKVAQWFNWPNWGNWSNWPNWGNWGNWFNR